MKKTSIYYFSLAAILAGSFVSCQEVDLGFDEDAIRDAAVKRQYAKNFEDRYGKMDSNHDWGFSEVQITPISTTRNTVVNRNEWNKISTDYHCVWPGWPFENQSSDSKYSGKYEYLDNSGNYQGLSNSPQGLPGGDVTDEEIQYVSWWFRTHKDPGKVALNLSDFFIQEVSSDCDRDKDGNALNSADIYEKNQTTEEYEIKGTRGIEFHQDYIEAKKFDSGWDHTSNFNYQASNSLHGNSQLYMGSSQITYNNETYSKRLCEFFTSSGTTDFQCHSSDDDTSNNHWALVHLVFDVNGRHYDGYYLGFDYRFFMQETDTKYSLRDYDGYYSNWIVKISAAQPMKEYTRRIMCEDLGNTLDFDMNDVVFDVTFTANSNDALITLQAAGGTLPIYVGDMNIEAHTWLGSNSTARPVNVNAPGGLNNVIGNYHITVSSTNPDDIPVYVQTSGNSATNIITLQPARDTKGNSAAPQKFCVPVGVRWMNECEQIEYPYQYFRNWVGDKDYKNNGKPWFANSNIDTQYSSKIYDKCGTGIDEDFSYDHSHGN